MQMKRASENVESLLARQRKCDERSSMLLSVIRDLVTYVHCQHVQERAGKPKATVGLFETDDEADRKREQVWAWGREGGWCSTGRVHCSMSVVCFCMNRMII